MFFLIVAFIIHNSYRYYMNSLIQEVQQESGKTTKRVTNRAVPTPKIKVIYDFIQTSPSINYIFMFADIDFTFVQMYRIRTPPSGDKTACWGKSTTVFDLNSDSSDQSDILVSYFYF